MVYDNQSFNADEVSQLIDDQVKSNPSIKFVVLDNLMKIDFSERSNSKYEEQSSFVKKLQAYAQTKGICVILVAHPNKVKTIPRIEDIGGSGDIINTADTVIFVHRVTIDFKKRADEYFGWKENAAELKADNLIEIVKDREFGDDNSFIGVFFEPTAKRFLNYQGEHVIYGFDVAPFQPRIMPMLEEIDDDGETPF
jgi:replicative DNA helicase